MKNITFALATEEEIKKLNTKPSERGSHLAVFLAKTPTGILGHAIFTENHLDSLMIGIDFRKWNLANRFLDTAVSQFFKKYKAFDTITLYAESGDPKRQKALERWYTIRGFSEVFAKEFSITRDKAMQLERARSVTIRPTAKRQTGPKSKKQAESKRAKPRPKRM